MKDSNVFYGAEEVVSDDTFREKLRLVIHTYIVVPFLIMWSDYRARIGFVLVMFWVLVGTVGVYLLPPAELGEGPIRLAAFESLDHPLGTDNRGHDLLRQTVHGTPMIWKMMVSGAVFATLMAVIFGTLSGYKGGVVDRAIMYVVDIAMTIPSLPLIIILAATIEPENPYVIGVVLSITAWAGLSRAIRSQVLSLRNESYIEASRTMGLSSTIILVKDVIPNLMPYITVHFVQNARRIIFSSVALYFLGFLPYSDYNWGVQLNLAYENGALQNPSLYYWFATPMLAIVTLSFGLILFAQGADSLFNPRLRATHEKTVTDIEGES